MITKVLSSPLKDQFAGGAYVANTGHPFVRLGVWVGSSEVCIPLTREQADALADQLKATHEGNTHVFVPADLITIHSAGETP